jgi:hypothetical protein
MIGSGIRIVFLWFRVFLCVVVKRLNGGFGERPLDAGGLSQRDSLYQVALLAPREAARVQRALSS